MFDNNFIGINDSRKVNSLIPLNKVCEISEKLFRLGFFDDQTNFLCRTDDEFVQFRMMFHVEQLRESADEVKIFGEETRKFLNFSD